MPTFGLLEARTIESRLPRLASLDTEAWALPGAEILQLAWETRPTTDVLLPRAMHPAIPRYVTFLVTRYAESPVGPFVLAQLRLMGRAGAHPRGFVLGAVTNTPEAAGALRERWGLPVEAGNVTLRRYHDRVAATVTREGRVLLEAALVDPETISGGDVQYIHSLTMAQAPQDGGVAPHLIQVDPHYTFHKAERGRPQASRFEASAWNAEGVTLDFPIAASVATADTDFPQIRFIMHPETPVIRGTKRIRQ